MPYKCAHPHFLGGAAVQEYTPEGFVWVEAGDRGTIHGGTHTLRERLDSKYGRYGLMWETIVEESHLPRLDMNIDFLKRSLEIADGLQGGFARGPHREEFALFKGL